MPAKRRRDPSGTPDDRPMNEEEWEAIFRESDLRSARFGEILETVRDDPDRERIVAREMGWTWITEALDEQEAAKAAGEIEDGEAADENEPPALDPSAAEAEADADDDDWEDDDDPDDIPFDPAARRAERNAIPAYKLATEVGMKVHDALAPYMSREPARDDDLEDIDERLGKAGIGCHIAAAKIAGGHAMGYEDDVLCGNIANCKRGLAGAIEAEEALLSLKADGTLPADLVDRLLPDVRAVIDAVNARIETLRARVWW